MAELPEHLFDIESMREFVAEVSTDTDAFDERLKTEGRRIADNYRRLFPEMSDKDIATVLIVFCQILAGIAVCPVMDLTPMLCDITGSYTVAAADVAAGVVAVDDMSRGL